MNINKTLPENESVIYKTRMHWSVFIKPSLFSIIVLITLAGVLFAEKGLIYWFLVLLSANIIWFLRVTLEYISTEYIVTHKKIIAKQGIFSTACIEIMLSKVESIIVQQGIWAKIFNYGNLAICGTGTMKLVCKSILDPYSFKMTIQKQIEDNSKENQNQWVNN